MVAASYSEEERVFIYHYKMSFVHEDIDVAAFKSAMKNQLDVNVCYMSRTFELFDYIAYDYVDENGVPLQDFMYHKSHCK